MTVTQPKMRALTTAAAPTTMDAETATGTQQGSVLKGKGTHRSWALLPEELVRYIATCYLWARASAAYVPATWEAKHLWHPRILYSSLRDAFHLERTLMSVCPQWGLALESHPFWQQAITLVDPTDSLAHLAIITPPQQPSPLRPYRLSLYRHFRQIVSCSCLVCRINNPATSRGLLAAKRTVNSYLFGLIPLCREHEHRRLAFCGFCLRESQVFELVNNLYAGVNEVGVLENEDDETFPIVEATCRSCRSEWLWKKASTIPLDQAAIGGPELCSDDWETRQSVDGFIELAEGTVTDVINLAREKYWLRRETRLGDMMQQALAAAKFNSSSTATASLRKAAGAGYGTPIEWEELEEEEEESSGEEDTELMQLEEGGVKDLALGDWARTRILDGYWISPADLWYHNSVPGKPLDMPAVHPCPWTIDSSTSHDPSQQHPQPHTIAAPIPPSFNLCEQAFISHGQQLRLILLPAMKNIVRRIAIECALEDSENENEDRVVVDPTLRASRLSLEEVMRVLREEEGVWYEGYDWVERRKNDVERERSERRRLRERGGDADEDDNVECSPTSTGGGGGGSGDSSSSSVGSNTTSPVLSTTTLQTTPSPPPLSDNDGGDNTNHTKTKENKCYSLPTAEEVISNKVLIPVEPVLNPPRVLRSIPYVPLTVEHLPQFSLEAFKNIWREACSPLYHCRCRICERAVAAANASPITTQQQCRQPPPAPVAPAVVDSSIILQPYHQQSKRDEVVDSPVQIQLQEVSVSEFEFAAVTEEGEEVVAEYENYDDGEGMEEEEMYDSEDLDSGSSFVSESASGGVVRRKRVGARKGRLGDGDEEEVEEEEEQRGEQEEEEEGMKPRIPSPTAPITVSGRTRKRSSDEIEDKEDRGMARGGSPPKRQRKTGVGVDIGSISSATSTTRTELNDASILPASLSGQGHHVERERVQRKRSSEELDDDYDNEYDDYTRHRGGHGGGGVINGEERVSRSWKKRPRFGDLDVSVGEEEGRSEGRNSRSRSPTTPTTTTTTTDTPTTTAGDDVDVDGSRSRSVTVSEGD